MPVLTDVSANTTVVSGLPQSPKSGPYVQDSRLGKIVELLAGRGFVGELPVLTAGVLAIPAGSSFMPGGVFIQTPATSIAVADSEEVVVRISDVDRSKNPVVEIESRVVVTPARGEIVLGARSGAAWVPNADGVLLEPKRKTIAFQITAVPLAAGTTITTVSGISGRIRRMRIQTRTAIDTGDTDVDITINGGTAFGTTTIALAGSAAGVLDDSGEIPDSANNIVEQGDSIEVQSDGATAVGVINVVLEIEE